MLKSEAFGVAKAFLRFLKCRNRSKTSFGWREQNIMSKEDWGKEGWRPAAADWGQDGIEEHGRCQGLRREDKPWQSLSRETSSKNNSIKGQLNINILICSLYWALLFSPSLILRLSVRDLCVRVGLRDSKEGCTISLTTLGWYQCGHSSITQRKGRTQGCSGTGELRVQGEPCRRDRLREQQPAMRSASVETQVVTVGFLSSGTNEG